MNNRITITILVSLLGASGLTVAQRGDFRSPLTITRGYMHWQLQPVKDTAWYPLMNVDVKEDSLDCPMYYEQWVTGFVRTAGKEFRNTELNDDGEIKNSCTSKTASLAGLFLGTPSFRGVQAFANSTLPTLTLANINPLLGSAIITPAVEYNEHGVTFGGRVEYRWGQDRMLHVGTRLSLPFKVVEVSTTDDAYQETLEDMFQVREIDALNQQKDIAIRFDFLNSLEANQGTPLIRQVNTPQIDLKVGDNTVSGTTAAGDSIGLSDIIPSMYVVRSGTVNQLIQFNNAAESESFRRLASEVSGPLNANGLGGSDGSVFFLKTGTDYAGTGNLLNNIPVEASLFMVPRALTSNVNELASTTASVVNRIVASVQDADLSNRLATDFFTEQGINLFSNARTIGLGDMDTELYVGYGHQWDWFIDGIFGIKIPTGTKQKESEALNIFKMQTGNNRHWEMAIGLEGGWQVCNWFAFKLGYGFHHAFKRKQLLPASFVGSTVQGIGPAVEGHVSWNYQTANADFTFFHPRNADMGWMVGYEFFAKMKDKVSFEQETAKDFLGNTQPLDSDLLEKNTKGMLHKIRGQIFHRWNYFEIFAGGSQAVGGRNAMKESEGHIGFVVYF